jgi:NAD(P)-dependent dehydrogenase (short-subunit alcohol dehydrogenase family)
MGLRGLRGRRALVTGAASGIGHAVAERLKGGVARVHQDRAHRPSLMGVQLCGRGRAGATIDVNGGWYFGP